MNDTGIALPPVDDQPSADEVLADGSDEREPLMYLLLVDPGHWSGLFDNRPETRRELGRRFAYADVTGEPDFQKAYLVTHDGRVLSAKPRAKASEYDEEDYADVTVAFRSPVEPEAGSYVVSYRRDGRA